MYEGNIWFNCVSGCIQKKSLKIPKGNQNPYIEEEQTTQWPKELEALEILSSLTW